MLCIIKTVFVKTMLTLLSGYDLNNDGKVTIEEFKRVMMKTGRVSTEDIEKMIGKADVDTDGYNF